MAASPSIRRTLAEAIAVADRTITVLDDKIDVEDRAVFRWLRGHQLHSSHLHNLVVGSQVLPAAWQAQTAKISSQFQAQQLLGPVGRDKVALRALEAALTEAKIARVAGETVVAQGVSALTAHRLWAIEVHHAPQSRFISKTTPTVFEPINAKLGTAVDFAYIAKLEGNQWLRGYIPIKRSGIVAGRSGMTVASGFDVGQWSAVQLSQFGFTTELTAKLKPFAEQPLKGLTKDQVAARVAELGPVPVLTKSEADVCDGAVFTKILAGAISAWDRGASQGVVKFRQLPAGWQTVWLSRYYQEGPATRVALGKVFRSQALAGEWAKAAATLKAYSDYKLRAVAEAGVLEAELPPAKLVVAKK